VLRGFEVKLQRPKDGRSYIDSLLAQHHRASLVSVGVRGHAHQDSKLSSAGIAANHEFGLGVPERPFMRLTFEQRKDDIQRLTRELEKRVLEERMTTEQALAVLGSAAVGYIRSTIDAGVPPPLSPETIKRKGSSKTLIDTAQMKGDISYEVHRGN